MSQDPEDNCPDEWQTSPPNLHDVLEQLESEGEQLTQGQADALQDNDEEQPWTLLVRATPAEIAAFRAAVEQALREPQPPLLVFIPSPEQSTLSELDELRGVTTEGWFLPEDRE
jgi:hypothetical protein